MSAYDNRIRRVFNAILHNDPEGRFLHDLWKIARRPEAAPPPEDCGQLNTAGRSVGAVFERSRFPLSTAFLHWAAQHPERLRVADHLGPILWPRIPMRDLFGDDTSRGTGATGNGLSFLAEKPRLGECRSWCPLEDFAEVDCCLETDRIILFIQANPAETLSPSSRWFPGRRQLWRDVEVARECAQGKDFGVILVVTTDDDGRRALKRAAASLDASCPHLSTSERIELSRHFVGCVTWPQLAQHFELNVTL